MIRGLYQATAAMVALRAELMRLANNAANLDTPGYKQDLAVLEGRGRRALSQVSGSPGSALPLGELETTIVVSQSGVDLSQGSLIPSGQPFDLALSGPGFFAVQREGTTHYTRSGSFSRDGEGRLTTSDGGLVLGRSGPIVLPPGQTTVSQGGIVTVEGQEVAELLVVEFPPQTPFRKVGHGYLLPQGEALALDGASNTVVHQGYLEGSNVDVVGSMIGIVALSRAYEANQRMIQLQDRILDRAANDVGRLA